MNRRFALAVYRLSVSAIIIAIVTAQTVHGFFRPPFDYANYFSFFSIQSCLLAAVVFAVSAIHILRGGRGDSLTFWRGAVTLYLTLAGTVYLVLLRGASETLQTPREQTNAVLHYLVPVALLADWCFTPRKRVAFRHALMWLAYPLFYVFYSLVRGWLIHWYPYPFLNPLLSGYATLATVCLVIAATMTGFIALLTWGGRRDPGKK